MKIQVYWKPCPKLVILNNNGRKLTGSYADV